MAPILREYEQVILDLDGCVWVGEEPTPRAKEAIEALRAAGKGVAFVTNNSRHAGEDFVARLWKLGIQASLADVVTVGGALQHLLAETRTGSMAYVIGEPTIYRHVEDAGLKVMNGTDLASRADLVLVSGTDRVDYDDLKTATLALSRGADFLATSRDPTYPTSEGLVPGPGALLAAIETASGRTAEIVGKPQPQLFLSAIDRLGDAPTLVVGDRVDADLGAATAAGLDAALVLTGGVSREEAEKAVDPAPVAIAETLADLVLA
ncbi:MAG: HAD-IIA family hydrolase [Thermoleophilaceae bacterium]|nr:HAD-IIA family hydrolase [Thermoleophilaceae bacterium]